MDTKIFVYGPESPEASAALQEKVAIVYADAVLQHIRKLPCPKEQKLELIDTLIKEKRSQTCCR